MESRRRRLQTSECIIKAAVRHGLVPAGVRRNGVTIPRTGGTTKHQTPTCAYRRAAVAQPAAKTAMLVDMASRRALGAGAFSTDGACTISARSIMICVVIPVINVEGGAVPR